MNSLKEVQEVSYEILAEIDRICKKNNIEYFLDSGTLLGAVRHKGFIPWDDDVDLVVKRENYEKLIKCLKEQLPRKYELILPNDIYGESFYDFTIKVLDLTTTINQPKELAEHYGGRLNHIGIDIFVLDECSSNKIVQKMKNIVLLAIYACGMGHRLSIEYEKYSLAEKVVIGCLSKIGKVMKLKSICRMYDNVSKSSKKGKSDYAFISTYPPKSTRIYLKKEWYKETIDMKFEKSFYLAPVGYDAILSSIYGDYMTLPPEEKRKPHHIYLDL